MRLDDAREELLARYDELSAIVAFESARFVVQVEGGFKVAPLSSRLTMVVVTTGERLAVIRREAE